MNQSLHLYLNDLVGNAQQLIITADNARIPMEQQVGGALAGEESLHSGYSSYSSLMDTSCNSIGSSSSRWDSEAGMIEAAKEKKSQRPRLPPRRTPSCSPPVSPVTETPRVRKTKKTLLKSLDDDDEDNDTADCCRRQRSASDNMSLVDATKGRLRMPQRRPSSNGLKSRRISSGGEKHRLPRSRREKRGDSHQSRNVSSILDDAIRELSIEQEMPIMQACS